MPALTRNVAVTLNGSLSSLIFFFLCEPIIPRFKIHGVRYLSILPIPLWLDIKAALNFVLNIKQLWIEFVKMHQLLESDVMPVLEEDWNIILELELIQSFDEDEIFRIDCVFNFWESDDYFVLLVVWCEQMGLNFVQDLITIMLFGIMSLTHLRVISVLDWRKTFQRAYTLSWKRHRLVSLSIFNRLTPFNI